MKAISRASVALFDCNDIASVKLKIQTIYMAYRQCYSKNVCKPLKSDEEYLKELYSKLPNNHMFKNEAEDTLQILHMCDFIKKHSNHQSPLEHASVTVRVTNMSRAASHQWVRHRLCAHSQQSQRYVGFSEEDTYYIPTTIAGNPEAEAIYTEHMKTVEDTVRKLQELVPINEDVRYIYPNAFTTEIVTTMNLRNWMHLFHERCCTHAQEEIRMIAWNILNQFKMTFPLIFDDLGPKCMHLKYCNEHKSCGFIDRVMKK